VRPDIRAGRAQSLARSEAVTALVLLEVVNELHDYAVALDAVLLAPNITLPGGPAAAGTGVAQGAETSVRDAERRPAAPGWRGEPARRTMAQRALPTGSA
jgi:fructose-bisphosphate aldolase, class I